MAKHALSNHDGFRGRREFFLVDPDSIQIDEGWNPREDFGDLDEMKESVRLNGVRRPLEVRKDDSGALVLIDGERRLRAVRDANAEGAQIKSVPVLLARKGISDIEALASALIANEGKPLDPFEEAKAIKRFKDWGLSNKEIAEKIGKSNMHITRRLDLIDATPETREAMRSGDLSQEETRQIVKDSGGSVEKQNLQVRKRKTVCRAPKVVFRYDRKSDGIVCKESKNLYRVDGGGVDEGFVEKLKAKIASAQLAAEAEVAGFDWRSIRFEIKAKG